MTVHCDMDGVIADMLPAWLLRYNRDYDDSLACMDITAWEMNGFVKPECGKRIYDYLADPSLYDDVRPMPGAQWGVDHLRKAGFRVAFTSSSAAMNMKDAKVRWLAKHGFIADESYVGQQDVVFVQDKSLLTKEDAVMVDDYPKNLVGHEGVLFDQPYNRQHKDHIRAYDWNDVVRIIKQGAYK